MRPLLAILGGGLLAAACSFQPQGTCSRDAECFAGQTCQSGVCVGCQSDLECLDWQTCGSLHVCSARAGRCGLDRDCASWQTCGAANTCVLAAGHCADDSACRLGERCNGVHDCVLRDYAFRTYATSSLWTWLSRAAAVDSQDRLYVTDGDTIFRIEPDGTPGVYLSKADMTAAIGSAAPLGYGVSDLDVGSDDRLYFVRDWSPSGVYVSGAPGAIALAFPLEPSPGFLFNMNVQDASRALLAVGYDGLFEATVAGPKLVDGTMYVSDCATPDFAVMPDGYVFYSAGCNGSSIFGGPSSGAPVVQLAKPDDMGLGYWPNFEGFGRDPQGGIIVNGLWALFHLAEAGGLTPLPSNMKSFAASLGSTDRFYAMGLAVGPTRRVYLVGGSTIFVAELVP